MSSPKDQPLTIEAAQSETSSANSEFLVLDDQQLDEQDRQEILESIEKVAAENRISANESLFKITPLKKGLLFPLLINILAAVAVVAGFVGSNIYFSRKQADISSQAGTFFSAEGKLIAQVKKESAAKLKAKDQEITQVKDKLTRLSQESTDLRNNMQATINAKEADLKKQMQTQLEAEKARLQKLGISQAEINTRLKTFEDQKNAEFAQQLSAFRAQNEAALQQKEAQIKAQQQQIQATLAQANKERQQLIDQAQAQEAQLRTQYEAKTQQLQSANQQLKAESTATQQKLQALSLQSQNEQLVSDQIVGSYNAILGDIQQAHYTQANADIASLKNLLNSSSVDSVPTLAKRRPVDLELLQSLQELIKARTQPGRPAVDPAVIQRSNQVAAAEKLVGQAEAAQKGGDAKSADELYTKAIAQVPIVQRAYVALTSVFKKNQSDQLAQREQTIAALRRESADKSAQIAQLQKSLANAQTSLRTAQATVADLRKQVADQSSQIAGLNKSVSSSGGTVSDLKRQIADQEKQLADLKSQLDQANSSVADLKKQLASGSANSSDLSKQLADEKKAAADAKAKLAEQTAAAEKYKKELDSASSNADALKKRLADNEKQIGTLKSELSTAQVRIKGLEKNATSVLDTFASIQNDYAGVKGQLTSLIASGTPQDIQKAREILLQFIDRSGVNSVLPGFSGVAADVNSATEKVAKTTGEQSGRENALNEVIGVTSYFSAPSANAASEKAKIDKTAATDPLFRETASDIQKLAQQSGQAGNTASLAVGSQLIGTISYIASNTVTVEKLVNVKVPQGATVVIQHKNGKGVEVPIAKGKVTKLASDSVEVTVESLLKGNVSPQLLDVVYLQAQAGA